MQAIAAEFVDQRSGDFKGHDVFNDHTGRRHSTHVAAFVARLNRLLRLHVDRGERFAERTDRLFGGTHDERLTRDGMYAGLYRKQLLEQELEERV